MSIWKKLLTALRGGAHEAGEAIVDSQALRILDQEIRDADTALTQGRRDLASLMARHSAANSKVTEYDTKIADLEAKALEALRLGHEALATEVAEVIADTTTQRDSAQAMAAEFSASVTRLTQELSKAEARIASLRQQVDMAKARESVQKAQVSASVASGAASGKLSTAAGTLKRLQDRQDMQARELQAEEELAGRANGGDLERRLREAGVVADPNSAQNVLDRLRKKQAEAQ